MDALRRAEQDRKRAGESGEALADAAVSPELESTQEVRVAPARDLGAGEAMGGTAIDTQRDGALARLDPDTGSEGGEPAAIAPAHGAREPHDLALVGDADLARTEGRAPTQPWSHSGGLTDRDDFDAGDGREDGLAQAKVGVDVLDPDDTAPRIPVQSVLAAGRRHSPSRRMGVAAATTFLLSLALGATGFYFYARTPTLRPTPSPLVARGIEIPPEPPAGPSAPEVPVARPESELAAAPEPPAARPQPEPAAALKPPAVRPEPELAPAPALLSSPPVEAAVDARQPTHRTEARGLALPVPVVATATTLPPVPTASLAAEAAAVPTPATPAVGATAALSVDASANLVPDAEPGAAARQDPTRAAGLGAQVAAAAPAQPARAAEPPPDAAATVAPQAESGADAIRITRARASPTLDRRLADAYAAFRAGQYARAGQLYEAVRAARPDDRDALLGLGATALAQGDAAMAVRRYRTVLDHHPEDTVASAALFQLDPGAQREIDTAALKLMLDHAPDAPYLHYVLGNRSAGEGRWAEAQQHYFDAYRLDASNADYAYNLAVSLDQIGQPQPALRYYRAALDLAREHRAGFDGARVRARIAALAATTDAP